MGANGCHLPKIIAIFAKVLGTELVDEEGTKQITMIWERMQSTLPPPALTQIWRSLSQEDRESLTSYLTPTSKQLLQVA
jgi:hypothetical protein